MSRQEKEKRDPQERVDRMNSIFDRLVLPMLIFTLALFVAFGVIPKIKTCASAGEQPPAASEQQDTPQDAQPQSPYARREELLSDFETNAVLFEAAGYVLADNDGGIVAYRALDSGLEIFENMKDSNGYRVSVLSLEEGERRVVVTVYSERIFLVTASVGDDSAAAIFGSDSFIADVSASDTDQEDVLRLVGSDVPAQMVAQYLESVAAVGESAG